MGQKPAEVVRDPPGSLASLSVRVSQGQLVPKPCGRVEPPDELPGAVQPASLTRLGGERVTATPSASKLPGRSTASLSSATLEPERRRR